MNEKEVAEIRRRFQPERSNITQVHGCYVNAQREIISTFNQSLASAPQEEVESILSVLKRSLTGALGKQLNDIVFETQQVVDSDEHRMLMALRSSALKDEGMVQAFCQRVIECLEMEGPYLILLAADSYDVPYRTGDGAPNPDGSCDVYSYMVCSICPIKETKPALRYNVPDSVICSRDVDWLISPPELGFLFPAFDDRSANIYNALYYTRKTDQSHPEFVQGIFRTEPPMPADLQQETFKEILAESLGEACCYNVVQEVHGRLSEMVEEHKTSKNPEPLAISKRALRGVLEACGVEEEKAQAFEEKYEEAFGGAANPQNLIDTKSFTVRTPDVTIKVSPDCGDLVETRLIDGRKYILVRVEGDVEVNGVNVRFDQENPSQEQEYSSRATQALHR
ncbi:DUF4317 domain-containing protein [Acutalibacter intestini]|uniref:DUF4317 domain-containing protein n=1 Tax=Acutalibacter intestini TaxID=3093659 RepID=UPI002AC96B7A|nr:DUF4317 domain-containing protein [Acutalibacter sp. M00204]